MILQKIQVPPGAFFKFVDPARNITQKKSMFAKETSSIEYTKFTNQKAYLINLHGSGNN